jgi:hypothetical protein
MKASFTLARRLLTKNPRRKTAVKNVSCASAACEKYEVASGPSPVEHLELYIWPNGDELGFERSLALRRKCCS